MFYYNVKPVFKKFQSQNCIINRMRTIRTEREMNFSKRKETLCVHPCKLNNVQIHVVKRALAKSKLG